VENHTVTLEKFTESTKQPQPPPGLTAPLRALWHDGRGDWDAAHQVAQEIDGTDGAWIHAYLHRKEGDLANAGYWYRRAKKPACRESLDAEWASIVTAMLAERA
jgi:hypothetical protein